MTKFLLIYQVTSGQERYHAKPAFAEDPSFHADFDQGCSKLDELQESESAFRPTDEVTTEQVYQYTIYQEYACVTAEEFEKIFRVHPNQGLPKVKSIAVPWQGPESSGKKLTHFWLVGLEGIPQDILPYIRKARLEYSDRVASDQIFLRPEDQLVSGQGQKVFGWLAAAQESKRPVGLSFGGGGRPMSFKDIANRMEREGQIQQEAVARASEAGGKAHRDGDEFDDLLSGMDAVLFVAKFTGLAAMQQKTQDVKGSKSS